MKRSYDIYYFDICHGDSFHTGMPVTTGKG